MLPPPRDILSSGWCNDLLEYKGQYTGNFTVSAPITLVGAGASKTFIGGTSSTDLVPGSVFTISNTSGTVVLDDMTIQYGDASNLGGGGILDGGCLSASNDAIIDSTTTNSAGGGGVLIGILDEAGGLSTCKSDNHVSVPTSAPTTNNCAATLGGTDALITDLGNNFSNDNSCQFSSPQSLCDSATVALGALGVNGGPTATMAVDPGSSAFNIVPASSSLCDGTYAFSGGASGTLAATDQRGEPRPEAGYQLCSSGAFQYQVAAAPGPTPTPTLAKTPSSVTVPTTHTGEPWDGFSYWMFAGLSGLLGIAILIPRGRVFTGHPQGR